MTNRQYLLNQGLLCGKPQPEAYIDLIDTMIENLTGTGPRAIPTLDILREERKRISGYAWNGTREQSDAIASLWREKKGGTREITD